MTMDSIAPINDNVFVVSTLLILITSNPSIFDQPFNINVSYARARKRFLVDPRKELRKITGVEKGIKNE